MKTEYRQSFLKEILKIKDPKLKNTIAQVIESVKKAETLAGIPNLKKLRGHQHFYRIRSGHYRFGISIESQVVTFVVLAHRKDIYKKFS
jgi:mRNA interferase RelE/StbE